MDAVHNYSSLAVSLSVAVGVLSVLFIIPSQLFQPLFKPEMIQAISAQAINRHIRLLEREAISSYIPNVVGSLTDTLASVPGSPVHSNSSAWLPHAAGGAKGWSMLLYASMSECIRISGYPVSTVGSTGRLPTEYFAVILAGSGKWIPEDPQPSYQIKSAGVGMNITLGAFEARMMSLESNTWVIEYFRGFIPFLIAFSVADPILSHLDLFHALHIVWDYVTRMLHNLSPIRLW